MACLMTIFKTMFYLYDYIIFCLCFSSPASSLGDLWQPWAKIDDISKMFNAELSEEYHNSPHDKKSAVL